MYTYVAVVFNDMVLTDMNYVCTIYSIMQMCKKQGQNQKTMYSLGSGIARCCGWLGTETGQQALAH